MSGVRTPRTRSTALAVVFAMALAGTSAEARTTQDTEAPAVVLTSPASGDTLSGVISLQADATDNEGIARVDFFVDGVLIGGDATAPFGVDWDSGSEVDGNHTLWAQAQDAAGNVTTSAPISVKVN